MKTTLKTKTALVAAFMLLFSLLPKATQAQINPPYRIVNNMSCPIVVSWDIQDNSCISCALGGPITIPASNFHDLIGADFGTCAPSCNISIKLTKIGGFTVGPFTASYSVNCLPCGGSVVNITGAPSGCVGANPNMDADQTVAHINP